MKNRFERLNKDEQKEAILEYTNSSEQHKLIVSRIKRLRVVGIVGCVYSIIMFIFDFLKERKIFDYGFNVFDNMLLSYIIDACLLIFCFIFIMKANNLLKEQVNSYLVDKHRQKQINEFKKKK